MAHSRSVGDYVEDVDGLLVPRTVEARDAYVVPTEPVSAAISTFVTRWTEEYQLDVPRLFGKNQPTTPDVRPLTATAYLAMRSGLSDAELQRFLNGETSGTTELRVADALLSAIGRPDLLSQLRVERPD